MRALAKVHVPRGIAALLVIITMSGPILGLGYTLSGPLSDWVSKAPETLPRIERRLAFLSKPLAKMQRTSEQVERIGDASKPTPGELTVKVKGPGLSSFLFSGTRALLTGTLTVIVLLFFMLLSGDMFTRRMVEILPTFSDKKQLVEISNEIKRHISDYLLTITLMNGAVGIATGFATYLYGLSDPILWGTMAFLLNYIMIIGPLSGAAILFLAGLVTFDNAWHASLLSGIYLAIHLIESQTITPMLLAKRLTLNPVLIIVSLLFWYWMWGVAGAILAVPLLATFKIVCDRVQSLNNVGHFLGTEATIVATNGRTA
jgi:predicted PurR-regulated permease PerM